MEAFYTDTLSFEKFSLEHFLSVLLMTLFGLVFIYQGKYRWSKAQKYRYALIFAVLIYFTQLFKTGIRLYLGNFRVIEDLPFHLCNMLPLFMIIGLALKSKKILGVIFFWIMAGTLQANITPTLLDTFPHYESIRYWVIHIGLPILAVYSVVVLNYKITFVDVIRSAFWLNMLAVVIYPLNYFLNSNYMYLNAKPPAGTLYDYLGPWPWYILSLEAMMLILYSLWLLPLYVYYHYSKQHD